MTNKIFLSILIPTYNRSKLLYKNLELLNDILNKSRFNKEIEILISDNHSVDDTTVLLEKFVFDNINHRLYFQKENIGPISNCLFLLKEAKGKYIMYLGDDDYLDVDYLDCILPTLKSDESIYSVIPATKSLFPNAEIKPGRDYYKKSKLYNKGFKNCLENSWRGTQLSATLHHKEGLYESYINQKVDNLYPYVYFIAYNCIRGKTWHMTSYPVTITQMVNLEANVNYGSANLIPDIFDNYQKLQDITYFQRILLETKLLKEQPSRYLEYLKLGGIKGLLNCMNTIGRSKSTTYVTIIFLPTIVIRELFIRIIRKIFSFAQE